MPKMLDRQISQQQLQQNAASIATIAGVPPVANLDPNNWVAPEQEVRGAKKIKMKDNVTMVDRVILGAGECVGTAMLVFIGCMSCVSGLGGVPTHLQISFAFGLAVMVAIQCVGHISGAHINPVVTIAAVIFGDLAVIEVPVYFAGQLIGAMGGFGLLKIVTPKYFVNGFKNETLPVGVCSPAINSHLTPIQGFTVELLITFILIFVCCGVWDGRNSLKHDSAPIRFGFTITVLAIVAGPYTGANMNPFRSFAPAFFNSDWQNHWVYWLGPTLGAIFGASFYRFIFSKENIKEDGQVHEVIPLNENNKV